MISLDRTPGLRLGEALESICPSLMRWNSYCSNYMTEIMKSAALQMQCCLVLLIVIMFLGSGDNLFVFVVFASFWVSTLVLWPRLSIQLLYLFDWCHNSSLVFHLICDFSRFCGGSFRYQLKQNSFSLSSLTVQPRPSDATIRAQLGKIARWNWAVEMAARSLNKCGNDSWVTPTFN